MSTARSPHRTPGPDAPARQARPSPRRTGRRPAPTAAGHPRSTDGRPRAPTTASPPAPSRIPDLPIGRRRRAHPRVSPRKSQRLMLAGRRRHIKMARVSSERNDEEDMLVATVRAFIDRDVRPTIREVEHANTYPEAWIEQMKRIGIYGLAIPESYGGPPVLTRGDVLVHHGVFGRRVGPG